MISNNEIFFASIPFAILGLVGFRLETGKSGLADWIYGFFFFLIPFIGWFFSLIGCLILLSKLSRLLNRIEI